MLLRNTSFLLSLYFQCKNHKNTIKFHDGLTWAQQQLNPKCSTILSSSYSFVMVCHGSNQNHPKKKYFCWYSMVLYTTLKNWRPTNFRKLASEGVKANGLISPFPSSKLNCFCSNIKLLHLLCIQFTLSNSTFYYSICSLIR